MIGSLILIFVNTTLLILQLVGRHPQQDAMPVPIEILSVEEEDATRLPPDQSPLMTNPSSVVRP